MSNIFGARATPEEFARQSEALVCATVHAAIAHDLHPADFAQMIAAMNDTAQATLAEYEAAAAMTNAQGEF